MNLLELREEINAALDYNPDLKQYRDMTARVLNRHYLQISTQYPWLFLHSKHRITLRADIEGDSDTQIQIGDATEALANTKVFPVGSNQFLQTPEMMGNYLVLKEGIDQLSANQGHGGHHSEYLITGLYYSEASDTFVNRYNVPDSNRPGTGVNHYLVVDRPIIDPSTAVEDGAGNDPPTITKVSVDEYSIQFRRYFLPGDCMEVLGIMNRGLTGPVHTEEAGVASTSTKTAPKAGRMTFLDARKEEFVYLDSDTSGDPVLAIEAEPLFVYPPPGAPVLVEVTLSDGEHGVITSTLQPGTTYEYCYTFLYCGIESPPSPVASITMSDNNLVQIKSLIDTRSVYADYDSFGSGGAPEPSEQPSGMYKRIYRRKADGGVSNRNQGFQRWHHIADVSESAGSDPSDRIYDTGKKVVTDNTTVGVEPTYLGWPGSDRTKNNRWTYHDGQMHKLMILDEAGPRQSLRVYRRPANDMDVEVRYLRRPRRLVADADTPEWPPQFHHLLVYKTLQDICLQHGMTSHSQLYEKRAGELLDRMRQKHLSRPDRMYVRSGFDRNLYGGERWGVPVKS